MQNSHQNLYSILPNYAVLTSSFLENLHYNLLASSVTANIYIKYSHIIHFNTHSSHSNPLKSVIFTNPFFTRSREIKQFRQGNKTSKSVTSIQTKKFDYRFYILLLPICLFILVNTIWSLLCNCSTINYSTTCVNHCYVIK